MDTIKKIVLYELNLLDLLILEMRLKQLVLSQRTYKPISHRGKAKLILPCSLFPDIRPARFLFLMHSLKL